MSQEEGGDKQPGFKVSAERLLQAINGGGTFELADFSPEEIEATLRLAASALRSSGLANEDETPRTAHEQVHGVRPSVSGNDSFHFVSATFARQLERELAEMTRYRDMNNAELGRMTAKCNALLDARSATAEPVWDGKLTINSPCSINGVFLESGTVLHFKRPGEYVPPSSKEKT